jgi:hypothetical protein
MEQFGIFQNQGIQEIQEIQEFNKFTSLRNHEFQEI